MKRNRKKKLRSEENKKNYLRVKSLNFQSTKRKIMIAVYKYTQANNIRMWVCEHKRKEE